MYVEVNVASQIRKIPKPLTEKIPPSLSIKVSIAILQCSTCLPPVHEENHKAPVPKEKRKKKSPSQKARNLNKKQQKLALPFKKRKTCLFLVPSSTLPSIQILLQYPPL